MRTTAQRLATAAAIGAAALSSGCAMFTRPADVPVDMTRVSNVSAISTAASRRVVIVVNRDLEWKGNALRSSVVYCAEPSPDVTENVASSISAAASASAEVAKQAIGGTAQAQAQVALAETMQRAAQLLTKRSQGGQLLRDGLYSLCQAHVNGALTDGQYATQFEKLLDRSAGLIEAELKVAPPK